VHGAPLKLRLDGNVRPARLPGQSHDIRRRFGRRRASRDPTC
jgi:hypothetical protein